MSTFQLDDCKLFILSEQIELEVSKVAAQINRDYKGKSPLLIGVLNGVFFAADLMKRLDLDCELTINNLFGMLKKANSIEVATLLYKPDKYKFDLPIKHVGFEAGNKFVVGYGLDYNGRGRNYKDIYVLTD